MITLYKKRYLKLKKTVIQQAIGKLRLSSHNLAAVQESGIIRKFRKETVNTVIKMSPGMNVIFILIVRFMKILQRKHSKKQKKIQKLTLVIKTAKLKITEQGTLDSLNVLGEFIRGAFESRNSKYQQYLSYTITLAEINN